MRKCKLCGGDCTSLGGGRYECDCCGNTFSEDDFISIEEKTKLEAARVKAAEEVKAQRALEELRIKADIEKAKIEAWQTKDDGAVLFERAKNGVLEISCQGKSGGWSGSGYIISSDGYAVTNAHVAADEDGRPCKKIAVSVCGKTIPATVVALADDKAGRGHGVDLAIIKLSSMPPGAKALPIADFEKVRTGQKVFVIGNSLGFGTCITSGIVSDKNREGMLMYDCATNGGNSGGPVFNTQGEVIGTHSAGQVLPDRDVKAQGMNYAVPANAVKEFIRKTGIRI